MDWIEDLELDRDRILRDLSQLRWSIDATLTHVNVKQEILAYVGQNRTTGQSEERDVGCGGDSVVPQQSVCGSQLDENQSQVSTLVFRQGQLLSKTRRNGLAAKIAALYKYA